MGNIHITVHPSPVLLPDGFEFVERKGLGHPDTLADYLAEYLSVCYSQYTLEHFGAILHHNFDKVGLMGGTAHVGFGKATLTSPIRVLLNGRASSVFGSEIIPVQPILSDACRHFFAEHFPMIDTERDLRLIYEVSSGGSPGAVVDTSASREGTRGHWFTPRALDDLPELKNTCCNDTSLGCAFYPHTILESLVLDLELYLNSADYKQLHPWVGSDIKIMAKRSGIHVALTIALPQIACYVSDLQDYHEHVEQARRDILTYCEQHSPYHVSLTINARDDYHRLELYLTMTGSSIETGDEGFVGRGNRIGGLITPGRPYSMEGICGKNPRYHTGKIYSVAAHEMAKRIYEETGVGTCVYLVGQSGQPLCDPWQSEITLDSPVAATRIQAIVDDVLAHMPHCTENLLQNVYRLC